MTEKENKGITIAETTSDPAWEKEIPAWFVMQINGHLKGTVDMLTAVSEENREMKEVIDDMRSYFMLKHQHEEMAKRLDNMSKQILDEIMNLERAKYSKKRADDHNEIYRRKRSDYDDDE